MLKVFILAVVAATVVRSSLAAEFNSMVSPDPTPLMPLFDQQEFQRRQQQIQLQQQAIQMNEMRLQALREERARRQQAEQPQVYYCRQPDGRFVICR